MPPRRSSLPGQLAERRSRSAYLSTAVSTAHSVTRETRVFLGFVGGIQKIFARIGDDAPIVVLAAAVYARKRLFVQQARKIVAQSYLAHQLHHDLVVVAGDIGCGEYAGQLVLAGSDLVVLGLSGYAQGATALRPVRA